MNNNDIVNENNVANDNKNEHKKDYLMLVVPVVLATFALLLVTFIVIHIKKRADELGVILSENEAIENIREGEIVDKLIINSQTKANVGVGFGLNGNGKVGVGLGVGGSEYVPMEYRIVIEGEYEFKGEKKKAKKEIQVSEDTYNSYKIGEHFDSRNLKINDSSGGYSVIKTDSSGELVVEQHIKKANKEE
ncbi:MAG: hypothetical protein J5956_10115 [Ruminococcus sp.]|nr:hypothetical protein [Ruminococcus sp.]